MNNNVLEPTSHAVDSHTDRAGDKQAGEGHLSQVMNDVLPTGSGDRTPLNAVRAMEGGQPGGREANAMLSHFSVGDHKIDMPSVSDLKNAPVDELKTKLDSAYEKLTRLVEDNIAVLPHLGFHGTSAANAGSLEQSKTSKGAQDSIYFAAAGEVESDPKTIVKDLMRAVDVSTTAGDSGAPAEKVLVFDTGLQPNRRGSYDMSEMKDSYLMPHVPVSENLAKDQLQLNPQNYDSHILGTLDTSPYAAYKDLQFDDNDSEKYTRAGLTRAFVEQSLTADALKLAIPSDK
jgi:hypothetical protein